MVCEERGSFFIPIRVLVIWDAFSAFPELKLTAVHSGYLQQKA